MEVLRGRPPGYTGMKGLTSDHCASVKSLGYFLDRIPHYMQLQRTFSDRHLVVRFTNNVVVRADFW
jgi:hypothetical protein